MQTKNGLLAIVAAGAMLLPAGAMADTDPVAQFFRGILASPVYAQQWDRDRAQSRDWSRAYRHDDDDDGRRGRRAHDDDDDGRRGRHAHDDDDDGRKGGRDLSRGKDRDSGRGGRGGRGGRDDNDDDD